MHPFFFTWSAQQNAQPLDLAGGKGSWFWDTQGNWWLDLAALVYQVNAGHGHTTIVEAIKAQADALCVAAPAAVYPAKTALAEKLLALAPDGFDRVFFTLGGAEANENALKMARLVTGRHKLISRYRSYHGATMGALTLSGDYRRPPLEPGLAGVVHAMDCYCDRCPFGQQLATCHTECAQQIVDLLDLEGPESVAAVFLEPVPGANGVLVPPDDYWPRIREACNRHGTLLVADEVLTGFGRTGKWFAFEHFGAVPDMITLGKAVTGGYGVLGAVLVHERVSTHFDDNVLLGGLTNYAHPLGIAAALAAIEVYESEDLITRAATLAPVFGAHLDQLRRSHGSRVPYTRSIGLLGAMELDVDADSWTRFTRALRDERVLTHPRGSDRSVVLSPPLCITEDELAEGFARIDRALAQC